MNNPNSAPAPVLSHSRVIAGDEQPEKWMVMLHGIYGKGRNWGSIARRLVDERPEWGVLLVDLRLHGDSQGFSPPHTVAAAAADVDALMRELKLNLAAILGHSFGGKVALAYAQAHAGTLRQVWIMDSTPAVREPEGSAWGMIEVVRSLPEHFGSRNEAVKGLQRHGYPAGVGQWMAMNLEQRDGRYHWAIDIDAVEAMLRDFFRTDLWPVVEEPAAGVSLHFVKATESNTLDAASAARLEAAGEANGRVFLHAVEGGHWINTDNPDAVVNLLAAHLP